MKTLEVITIIQAISFILTHNMFLKATTFAENISIGGSPLKLATATTLMVRLFLGVEALFSIFAKALRASAVDTQYARRKTINTLTAEVRSKVHPL